ncbi:hypothetical protein J28TS4_12680 [Paenibacillus lautus]|nr:hypothetical protein J28TS4_12680 [Paenibacillus lautus]
MGKYGFDQSFIHRSIQRDDVLREQKSREIAAFYPWILRVWVVDGVLGSQGRKLSKGFSVDLDMLHNCIIPNR